MLDQDISLIKLEGHNHAAPRPFDKKGILRKFREAFDPEAAEEVYAKKDMIVARSIKAIAKELQEAGTPAHLAVAQAYEIKRGSDHLSHINSVMDYTEAELDEEKTYELPNPSFMSDYIPVIENVTDERVQRLFGKILAGEMESEGSFSRPTLWTLSQFSKRETDILEKICAVSFGGHYKGEWIPLIPVLIGGAKGNDKQSNCITNDELRELESFGIIKNDMIASHNFKDGDLQFCVAGRRYFATNTNGAVVKYKIAKFTNVGKQLSTLFDAGVSTGFIDIVRHEWGKQGVSIVETDE